MFATITGIAINDQKEIFVTDKKYLSLRKYDWAGNFIAKTSGQKGQGPGDFLSLALMGIVDNKLMVFDFYNRRIAITDTKFRKFDYIRVNQLDSKIPNSTPILKTPVLLEDNRFLGVNSLYDPENGRFFIYDRKLEILAQFFCALPADIADKKNKKFFNTFTRPIAGVNYHKKQILVSFVYPDREIAFQLFDFSGQLIRSFSYKQEEEFNFPMALLDDSRNDPPRQTMIWDILGYKSYYMVFVANLFDFDKPLPEQKMKFHFLFFRETGEMIHKMPWNVRLRTISQEGYMGGVKEIDDVLKVMIYKFNPDALEKIARKK